MKTVKTMKTAISIPNTIFYDAESLAKKLGMARSELYTKAIKEFLDTYEYTEITETLNKLYSKKNSTLDPELTKMQFLSLDKEEWE